MSIVYRSAVNSWAARCRYSLTRDQVNEAVVLLQRIDAARAQKHKPYMTLRDAEAELFDWLSQKHQEQMKERIGQQRCIDCGAALDPKRDKGAKACAPCADKLFPSGL